MKQEEIDLELISTPYGIEATEIADRKYKEALEKTNSQLSIDYASCFSTPSGKKVLKHLVSCTLDQPTWVPDQGDTGVHHSFLREGQNSIVREVVRRSEFIINQTKLKNGRE